MPLCASFDFTTIENFPQLITYTKVMHEKEWIQFLQLSEFWKVAFRTVEVICTVLDTLDPMGFKHSNILSNVVFQQATELSTAGLALQKQVCK
jgi:hypothetical protein